MKPPTNDTMLGVKRFDQATTKGAPIVMSEMERVPMRSIAAVLAPVNGVPGWPASF